MITIFYVILLLLFFSKFIHLHIIGDHEREARINRTTRRVIDNIASLNFTARSGDKVVNLIRPCRGHVVELKYHRVMRASMRTWREQSANRDGQTSVGF